MTRGRQVAVCDIDGVLADVRHRLHHLEPPHKNWGAFFRAAVKDPPLPRGLDTARELARVYEIVYLSGRPERCRKDTERWFEIHELPPGRLLLRPHHDRRPAREYKVEVLRRLAADAEVVVLVDDDPDVVRAVTAAGFDVLHATWMGADAPEPEAARARALLHQAQESEGRS